MSNDTDADIKQQLAEAHKALALISRMKRFPDDRCNRVALLAAIRIAERFLPPDQPKDNANGHQP